MQDGPPVLERCLPCTAVMNRGHAFVAVLLADLPTRSSSSAYPIAIESQPTSNFTFPDFKRIIRPAR